MIKNKQMTNDTTTDSVRARGVHPERFFLHCVAADGYPVDLDEYDDFVATREGYQEGLFLIFQQRGTRFAVPILYRIFLRFHVRNSSRKYIDSREKLFEWPFVTHRRQNRNPVYNPSSDTSRPQITRVCQARVAQCQDEIHTRCRNRQHKSKTDLCRCVPRRSFLS